MFNARTGRFTANDYMYNVEHLTEYNRMKRMNNQYFDQDAWERDMALHNAKRKRDEEAGVVPKQLSKKDMVSPSPRGRPATAWLISRNDSGRRSKRSGFGVRHGCATRQLAQAASQLRYVS